MPFLLSFRIHLASAKEALLEVKDKRGMFPTLQAVAVAHNPTDSHSLHPRPLQAFQHLTLGCRLPCPLLHPCLMPLSLLSPRPACPDRVPPVTSVFSLLGTQPPRILVLHSLGNAMFLGFNPVRAYGDP